MATTYLLTGASGTLGGTIVQHLRLSEGDQLYLAFRHPHPSALYQRWLDFEQPDSFAPALKAIDVVFLLRPPQLADVRQYFKPFIDACQRANIRHLVFLSVQGADQLSFIPHARIERLIAASGLVYTFIRPSYFMQNLTTVLRDDVRLRHRIFLPAGEAKFLWVDARDVGQAIARVLEAHSQHRNRTYTITGTEAVGFTTVSEWLSQALGHKVRYESPNLFSFYWQKRQEGLSLGLISVMGLLHVLPRFQKPARISTDYYQLTGQQPQTLASFITQHLALWQ